jgi:hypothetical protein
VRRRPDMVAAIVNLLDGILGCDLPAVAACDFGGELRMAACASPAARLRRTRLVTVAIFSNCSYNALCPIFGRRFLTSWIRRKPKPAVAAGRPKAAGQAGRYGPGRDGVNFLYMGSFFTFRERGRKADLCSGQMT